eukprot:5894794-Pyramimonas_sp.AAC.1
MCACPEGWVHQGFGAGPPTVPRPRALRSFLQANMIRTKVLSQLRVRLVMQFGLVRTVSAARA